MNVLEELEAAGMTMKRGKQQIMLFHNGRKIGGWNTKDGHWYISKTIARDQECLLRKHGFRWREKPTHQWWQLDGEAQGPTFRAVVRALTETPIP